MDTGSLLYYGGLAVWSALIAYTVLFSFAKKKAEPEVVPVVTAPSQVEPLPERRAEPLQKGKPDPATLMREGFKAFQKGEDLAVEDIVKGLSRE
jgi:hypothetical protein